MKNRRGPPFPQELTDKIVEALEGQPNAVSVAQSFLVSESAVRRIALVHGIALGPKRGRPKGSRKREGAREDARYQPLIQLLEEGKNLAEATRELGLSYQSARIFLLEKGVPFKGNRKERTRLMIEALKKTPNAAAVARQFGVTRQAISAFAKRENIPLASVHRSLSGEEKCEIVDALVQCSNAAQVQKGCDASYSTIRNIACRAGIELSSGRASMKRKREAMLAALREEPDIEWGVLMKRFGVSGTFVQTVKQAARESGIPVPETKFPDVLKKKIIATIKENPDGFLTHIAAQFCVSAISVRNLAKKEGVPLRKARQAKGTTPADDPR